MTFLMFIALLLAVTVVPVMIGARIVKAKNTGFGAALFAIILLTALSAAVEHFFSSQGIAFIVSAFGGAAILAGTLGTTFLRGLVVSVIVVAVQFAVILGVAGTAFGLASLAT